MPKKEEQAKTDSIEGQHAPDDMADEKQALEGTRMQDPDDLADEKQAPGRTRIIISSNTGPAGSDDVFVSVNGRDFLIKRDVEVEVPEEVLGVLKNAVVTDYVTDADGRITRERRVPRFPYQVL